MSYGKSTSMWLGLLAIAASVGCSSLTPPTATEQDFGNSVRHMISSQTANPNNPTNSDPINEGDGERINNALETYRTDVGIPERVRDDITIDIGDSR